MSIIVKPGTNSIENTANNKSKIEQYMDIAKRGKYSNASNLLRAAKFAMQNGDDSVVPELLKKAIPHLAVIAQNKEMVEGILKGNFGTSLENLGVDFEAAQEKYAFKMLPSAIKYSDEYNRLLLRELDILGNPEAEKAYKLEMNKVYSLNSLVSGYTPPGPCC